MGAASGLHEVPALIKKAEIAVPPQAQQAFSVSVAASTACSQTRFACAQEPRLFSESVAANIAYGLEGISREQVEEAAMLANADGFIRALPEGYDTKVETALLSPIATHNQMWM